jgi:dTDP-L-rhamnose 4-epimerase
VRVLDTLEPAVHGEAARLEDYCRGWDARVEVTLGSVADRALLAAQLEGVDAVLHLAALVSVPGSLREMGRYSDTNVTGTAHLADLLPAQPRLRRVVLASSRAVYGEGPQRCPAGCPLEAAAIERDPQALARGEWEPACPRCGARLAGLPAGEEARLHPVSVYGLSKAAQEELLRLSLPRHAARVDAFRLQNVYGPGQSRAVRDVGVANILAEQALRGDTLQLFEDGEQVRDFVLLDDVAELLSEAVLRDLSPARFASWNVGSGVGITLRELAEAIFDTAGLPRRIRVTGEWRLGDVRHCVARTERLAAAYPWKPLPLADGLARLLRWLQA